MKVARQFVPPLVRAAALAAVAAAVLAAVLAGCRTTRTVAGAELGPRRAVQGFLAGVRAQDARVVADHWGTRDGPARARMSEQELEQRVFVMMRCLRHDSARVTGEIAGASGSRVLRVDLFRGPANRQTAFTTVSTGGGKWYVEQVDMEPVRDLCAMR